MASPEVEAAVPGAGAAYASLVPAAYRADLWRLVMVYMFGGVYADMSVWLAGPLDGILGLSHGATFVMPLDNPGGCPHGMWNGFFAATPRHPLVHAMARVAVARVAARVYGDNVLDIAGPCALGRVVSWFQGRTGHPWDAPRGAALQLGAQTMQSRAGDSFKAHILQVQIVPGGPNLMVGNGPGADLRVRWPEYYTDLYGTTRPTEGYPSLWNRRAVYRCDAPSSCLEK
jgi:hypothetical protein